MDNLVVQAIRDKMLIKFNYHGFPRIAEPHIFGIKHGVKQMLIFQVDGDSSKGKADLPNWRRVDLAQVTDLVVLDQAFSGPRPYPSGKHSSWDVQLEVVK
jgi:hypothetical protein